MRLRMVEAAFGDAQLLQAQIGQVFADTVADGVRAIGAGQMEIRAVAAQCAEVGQFGEAGADEAIESLIRQRAGDLARAVGAEVHEHRHIVVLELHLLELLCKLFEHGLSVPDALT